MKLPAPAKVNLYLKVVRRRPDGYHDLCTVFQPVACPADELELVPASEPGITLSVPGRPELEGEGNLIYKAAIRYATLAQLQPAWHFTLTKRIPMAAGLGGGSSDCAAALTLLNRTHHALSDEALALLAKELGADVPFFLSPRPALAEGIGEKLTPLEGTPANLPIVIVNPVFPVSAAWAYRRLAPESLGPAAPEPLLNALKSGDLPALGAALHNDLAPALLKKFPLLRLLLNEGKRFGALGGIVSGSGSSCFFLAADAGHREELAEEFRLAFPLMRVF